MSNSTFAQRQAALVAALTSGAPVPGGFDRQRVEAAERALRNKRAGVVARSWPLLAAGLGDQWNDCFCRWAHGRPSQGALRDGWDLARELAANGQLPELASSELAFRDIVMKYDGRANPRRRWLPKIRRLPGTLAIGVLGHVRLLGR